jgi:hypothetical protein
MTTIIDKASEVKLAFMVFQKPPPGVSHTVIISAQLQSNNECLSFTADIMNAADFVTKQFHFQSTSFTNFAVDWCELGDKGCHENYMQLSLWTLLLHWSSRQQAQRKE